LTGLDNLSANSITDLDINNNSSLSTCEVQSICEYLVSHSGTVEIHDNATGCNDQQEVEAACGITSVEEVHLSDKVLIYPNPSSTQITIELPNIPQKNAVLTIYSISSQQLITRHITEQRTIVDVSSLPTGFYFANVADDKTVMVSKLVKD